MKILLETIFGIIFIGIIIACLPTIMGLFSLCVIAYFIYQAAKSLIEDGTEKADAGHDGCEPDSKQDRSAEWQSVQDTCAKIKEFFYHRKSWFYIAVVVFGIAFLCYCAASFFR